MPMVWDQAGLLSPGASGRFRGVRRGSPGSLDASRGGSVGGTPCLVLCDCASSPQGGMEEQAMGLSQPAGMSGRIWADNATLLDLLQGKEFQRNVQAAANDPRRINTQLTADPQHRNHF